MDIEQIRVRIMSEAYDLADKGDHEEYNALKAMCNDVLELIAAVVAAERDRMCEQFNIPKELAHEKATGNEAD